MPNQLPDPDSYQSDTITDRGVYAHLYPALDRAIRHCQVVEHFSKVARLVHAKEIEPQLTSWMMRRLESKDLIYQSVNRGFQFLHESRKGRVATTRSGVDASTGRLATSYDVGEARVLQDVAHMLVYASINRSGKVTHLHGEMFYRYWQLREKGLLSRSVYSTDNIPPVTYSVHMDETRDQMNSRINAVFVQFLRYIEAATVQKKRPKSFSAGTGPF